MNADAIRERLKPIIDKYYETGSLNQEYIDPGYEVSDNYDNDLNDKVVVYNKKIKSN